MNAAHSPAARAVIELCKGVIAAVQDTPEGVPAGTLYSAMMMHGCTLEQFTAIMDLCVATGQIRKAGQLYMPVTYPVVFEAIT